MPLDDLLTYFFIAVALGADALSLALGLGVAGPSRRAVMRASFTVGVFHVFMPLAGLLVGSVLGVMVGRVAIWMGGVILVVLGLKMIWEGWPWRRTVYSFQMARKALEMSKSNSFSWGGILALGWSVSVDAFGVGVGLGAFVDKGSYSGFFFFVIILGVVAALMTAAGLLLGRWLSYEAGKGAEIFSGLVLAGIGVKMLF